MELKRYELREDESSLRRAIEEIIAQIKNNPDELEPYKKFVRKNVAFFHRTFFSAYLFRAFMEKRGVKYTGSAPVSAPVSATASAAASEKGMTTLFISIGKNKKVFPRDLHGFLLTSPGLKKSDIGEIRILDNYSFAEIAKDAAPAAINNLNGKSYKGRKISVNFARKKGENEKSP